jgi:iron(III) transport system substrate-binding protein
VARLAQERSRPRCDVFWNNEIARTIQMKDMGLLEAYFSPAAEGIPEAFRDEEGYWTGFAARARVLAYNTELVDPGEVPRAIEELADERWRGRIAMAYPLFGTTATHAAVLFADWGEERARAFFEALAANQVRIVEGNATACRMVAAGEIPLALTDTDDATLLRSQGKSVDFVMLGHGDEGALLIPNTVALIKSGPNPQAGRRLIDYLLSPEVESRLAHCPSAQIPLRPGVDAPEAVRQLARGTFFYPDYEAAARLIPASADFLKGLFGRR